jgi:glycerol-3-phosphate dehydrogenase
MARTVADMLVRRLHLFYETRDKGVAAVPAVTELMGNELGWSSEEQERQIELYLKT